MNMSDDLLQSIIQEAAQQRQSYAAHRSTYRPTPATPYPTVEAPLVEETPTSVETHESTSQLNDTDTDDIVAGMLESVGVTPIVPSAEAPTETETIAEDTWQGFHPSTSPEEEPVREEVPEEQEEIPTTEEESSSEDPNEIPTLHTEASMRESTSRFSGAEWFKVAEDQEITFAGLGGIGSWAAFLLSRIHPYTMYLYDPDTVETVNLSGQLYGMNDVFDSKVSALASFINSYSNYYDCRCHVGEYTQDCPTTNVMISGFDNMAAREMYFNAWYSHVSNKSEEQRKECLFIDARMSAEDIQILCLTGDNQAGMEEYRKNWLFSDEEADAHVCSYKQTSFCAAIIGGLISNLFVNFCTNLSNPVVERPLPFLTTYDASLMFLNVKN